MTLGYTSGMILWPKGQRSRSQGHKVQKHIEGDRVAGVSLHLYRVLTTHRRLVHLYLLTPSVVA